MTTVTKDLGVSYSHYATQDFAELYQHILYSCAKAINRKKSTHTPTRKAILLLY